MAALAVKPHVVVEDGNDDVSEGSISNDEESGADSDHEGADAENSGDEEQDEENPNAGWAEAMAKVLGKKTPDSKPSILLKNKQLDKIKEKEKKERLEKKKQMDKKRAWENICREKPDVVQDREHERNLQRIATRGVVQLFNALKNHQTNVNKQIKEVGGSERKKSKILSSVSKKDFIDVLRGTDVAVKKEKGIKVEKSSWSVLKDDFMMGASMKDWDKESDEDGEGDEDEREPAQEYSSESD
ncbi:RRP15-like protein [Danio aesculapii]|uniref:RRP15-like protein n=1 Tax=Danio aesculapii TaxID=1142201 RepID=UPI0024C069C4|nr:RRP15-like protein [Danio aesculapii]